MKKKQKFKKKIKQVMSNKENRKFYITSAIIIGVILITSILLISINFSKAMDTSTLLSDQVVDNLKFMNATLENNKLTVVVYNTLDDGYRLKTIDVTFQDENGKEITTIKGYIGSMIEQKDMRQLVVSTDIDLTSATHIKYTINK